MARHTFVTESHTTYDETETVDIPTRTEIKKIAAEAMEVSATAMSAELRKVAKTAETATKTAKAAALDATTAREEVIRLVETAREAFRAVIEELLAPHYRYLEEQLGIKPLEVEQDVKKPQSRKPQDGEKGILSVLETDGRDARSPGRKTAPSKTASSKKEARSAGGPAHSKANSAKPRTSATDSRSAKRSSSPMKATTPKRVNPCRKK